VRDIDVLYISKIETVRSPVDETVKGGQRSLNRMEQHRKSTVVITGASSGSVCKQQSSFPNGAMACGDGLSGSPEGGKSGQAVEVPQDSYTIMHLDLASLEC